MSDEVRESNWMIRSEFLPAGEKRTITNSHIDTEIQFNYERYTPIVLAPVSKYSVFVVSAYYEEKKLKMCISDLRYMNGEFVSGFMFLLRGSKSQLTDLKNTLNRFCDTDRCVALGFLFRKIFNCGFHCFYGEKILKPKVNSSLKAAVTIIQSATDHAEEYESLIQSIGGIDMEYPTGEVLLTNNISYDNCKHGDISGVIQVMLKNGVTRKFRWDSITRFEAQAIADAQAFSEANH